MRWKFPRLHSLAYGFTLPLRAGRLILTKPSLLLWSLLPIAATLLIYVYVIMQAQDAAHQGLVHYFDAWGWKREGWLAWSVIILIRVLLVMASALTFSLAATIVSSPFNDFLAEATEKWTDPPLTPAPTRAVLQKLKLIGLDVAKSLAATGAGILAILFSWLPGLNVIALIFTFVLLAFQFLTYPQTRRGLSLSASARFILRHVFSTIGFGAALALIFAVPFVACLGIPLAVVGGTLLFARAEAPAESDFPKLK